VHRAAKAARDYWKERRARQRQQQQADGEDDETTS
jgi:hypothetical protein